MNTIPAFDRAEGPAAIERAPTTPAAVRQLLMHAATPTVLGGGVLLIAALTGGTLTMTSFGLQAALLVAGILVAVQRSQLGLLSPMAMFLVGGAIYSIPIGLVVASAGYVFDQRDIGDSLIGRGAVLVIVAFGAALTGYGLRLLLGRSRIAMPAWTAASTLSADGLVGWSLLGLGALAMVALMMAAGGPLVLMSSAYGERYLLLEGLGPLAVGLQMIVVGALITTATMLHHKRERLALGAVALAVSLLLLWVIVSGSRTSMFQLLVGLAGLLQASGRRVRTWVLLSAGLVAMVVGILYGSIRGNNDLADAFESSTVVLERLNPANQEFGTAAATAGEIAAAVPELEPYHWGETFVRAFGVLVPRAIWPNRPESLPEWYVRRFYPDVAAIGGGYAFSPVAEAWLNFGAPGLIVIFLLIGVGLASVEARIVAPMSPWPAAVFAALLPWMFAFARLDSATMLKSIGVNVLAVLAVAFLTGRLLVLGGRRHVA